MQTPFTYCITHMATNKRYYGSRYSKNCNTCDLGVTYFSSSKHMKKLIKEEGSENFRFEIRKIFTNVDDCRSWEHRVLKKLNAAKSDNWYNKHNGGQKFYCTGHTEITRLKMSETHKRIGTGKGPKTQNVRKAVSISNSKRIWTEEQKLKMSIKNSGSGNPMFGKKGKDNPNYGQIRGKNPFISKSNSYSVMCEGVEYASIKEAQEHYKGISIKRRLDNSKFPDFFRIRPKRVCVRTIT